MANMANMQSGVYMDGSAFLQNFGSGASDQNRQQSTQVPLGNLLNLPSLKSTVSLEEQRKMSGKIKSIFDLERPEDEDTEMIDGGEEIAEPTVDLADQAKRTEDLKEVVSLLSQLWWADSTEMDEVTEKVADGSRDSRWRIPIGDSGMLDFYIGIFSTHILRPSLKIHVLRLIGNSCADTDENRARVVASSCIPSILTHLSDTSLLPFVIPVLYNICLDYEPAQQQASAAYLTKNLIELISSPKLNEIKAFLGYVCKLLDLMVTQPTEVELAPENTAVVLLGIAADRKGLVDLDDYINVVNTALSYLQHEKFQKTLMAPGAMDQALAVLVDSYTRFDSHPSVGTFYSPDQEDAKALQQMRSNFNQILSDVSALPEFNEICPPNSPLANSLRRWLLSPQSQLQVCGCIMLGNVARSKDICEEFVNDFRIHLPLISILNSSSDSQLLHAALSFLKNLSLPAKNKDVLGESGLFDVLPRLWAPDTLQQIQLGSISLARQLTIENFQNVRRVCKRLSTDPDSPAHARTNLSLLIAIFERTDVEAIKVEVARLITSICRVFHSSGIGDRSPEELKRIRTAFLDNHPDIGRPLSFMVSQKKWPLVRSEGWFVFALMSRYPEGAKCVSDLFHDIEVFKPLVRMMTGKELVDYTPGSSTISAASPEYSESSKSTPSNTTPSRSTSITSINSSSTSTTTNPAMTNLFPTSPASPTPSAQETQMAIIDRENAVLLLSEMLKNRGSEMAVIRRTLFEDLLKGGSEIVLSYREGRHGLPTGEERKRPSLGMHISDLVDQNLTELI